MLSKTELERIRQEHWDPLKTVDSFRWAVQSYCSDFNSTREGIKNLVAAVEKHTKYRITPAVLQTYAYDSRQPEPRLTTVAAVLGTILAEGK